MYASVGYVCRTWYIQTGSSSQTAKTTWTGEGIGCCTAVQQLCPCTKESLNQIIYRLALTFCREYRNSTCLGIQYETHVIKNFVPKNPSMKLTGFDGFVCQVKKLFFC